MRLIHDWQLYPWLALASLSGFVTPAFQAIMTGQTPANAQGELQGAMSCLNSIASIIGPVMLTQLFGRATAEAPVFSRYSFSGGRFTDSDLSGCFFLCGGQAWNFRSVEKLSRRRESDAM